MTQKATMLFHEYYKDWIDLYKVGAVREVTLKKYRMTNQKILELAPKLKLNKLTRQTYQKLLNDYALTHERQTTMDFHHQLRGAILDALDDNLLTQDPTRKAIIKGKKAKEKKSKFLNQFELQALIKQLELSEPINWDWFIFLIAKTGLRFSEALGLTPNDFDFSNQTLKINKTWDYKNKYGSFQPTKNKSSIRTIPIDWQLAMKFSYLLRDLEPTQPIFVNGRVFNSTINDILGKLCLKAQIPNISIHGLRHTHASLLIFAGVSVASVARRLGHSSMTTTQETYLHIIQELENQDNDKIIRCMSTFI